MGVGEGCCRYRTDSGFVCDGERKEVVEWEVGVDSDSAIKRAHPSPNSPQT